MFEKTVAFFGQKGVGKNYLAEQLVKILPEIKFEVTAFADPIKELVESVFGLEPDLLWGESSKREKEIWLPNWDRAIGLTSSIHPHQCSTHQSWLELQVLKKTVLEMNRECAEERRFAGFFFKYWRAKRPFTARYALRRISEAFKAEFGQDYWVRALETKPFTGQIRIITDGRFPIEAQSVANGGGLLIRVSKMEENSQDQHPTEMELYKIPDMLWTHWIINDPPECQPDLSELIASVKALV